MSILSNHELENMYDELLNEHYELIEVCGRRYRASFVIKEIDPIHYRNGMQTFLDESVRIGVLQLFGNEYADL